MRLPILLSLLLSLFPTETSAQQTLRQWMQQADDPRAIGLQEYQLGNFEAAKPFLQRALEKNPGDIKVRDAVIKIYTKFGLDQRNSQPVEASYWFAEALKLNPLNPPVIFELARAYFRMKDYDRAIETALNGEAKSIGDDFRRIRQMAYRAYYRRGLQRQLYNDLVNARDDYLEARERNREDPRVSLRLGQIDIAENLWQLAYKDLGPARGDAKLKLEANYLSAIALQNLSKWVESLPFFRATLTETSYIENAHQGIAYSQLKQGSIEINSRQFDSAEKRLIESSELRPQWPEAWFELGRSRVGLRNGYSARDAFAKTEALDAKYPKLGVEFANAYVLIGANEYNNKQLPAAKSAYSNAVAYDDTRGDAYFRLGVVEQSLQDWEAAVLAYKKAQERSKPYYNVAGVSRGDVLFRALKRYREAITVLEDVDTRIESSAKKDIQLQNRGHGLLIPLYKIVGTEDYREQLWDKSIVWHTKLFRLQPQAETQYKTQFGISYHEIKDFDNALTWLQQAYNEVPSDENRVYLASTHVGLADRFYESENWLSAIPHFEAARKLRHNDRKIDYRLAVAYRWTKQWEASAKLLRALRATPVEGLLASSVDSLLVEVLGLWSEEVLAAQTAFALERAEEALLIDSSAQLPLYIASAAKFELNEWRDSLAYLDTLLGLNQNYRDSVTRFSDYSYAGIGILSNQISWPEAIGIKEVSGPTPWRAPASQANLLAEISELANRAIQNRNNVDRFHIHKGFVQFANGNYPGAIDSFDTVSVADLEYSVRAMKGHMYTALQQRDQALDQYLALENLKNMKSAYPVTKVHEVVNVQYPQVWSQGVLVQDAEILAYLDERARTAHNAADIDRENKLLAIGLLRSGKPYWSWRVGHAYLQQNEFATAEPHLQKAIRSNPDSFPFQLSWAKLKMALKQWQQVLDALVVFEEEKGEIVTPLLQKTYRNYSFSVAKEAPNRALTYAKLAFDRDPNDIEIAFHAATLAERLEDWGQAADFYLFVYRLDPTYRDVVDNYLNSNAQYANKLLTENNVAMISVVLDAMNAISNEHNSTLFVEGLNLYANSNWSKAIPVLHKFINQSQFKDAREYFLVALRKGGISELISANILLDWKTILQVVNRGIPVPREYVKLLKDNGHETEAVVAASANNILDMDFEEYDRITTCRNLVSSENIPELKLVAESWQAEKPQNPKAKFWVGRYHELNGSDSQAAHWFREALMVDPENEVYEDALDRVD
jgi:tetratricopeptide (TPR) repeat protein